jgi:Fungal Zn(2)-Cys(6) binuclear cluster domain
MAGRLPKKRGGQTGEPPSNPTTTIRAPHQGINDPSSQHAGPLSAAPGPSDHGGNLPYQAGESSTSSSTAHAGSTSGISLSARHTQQGVSRGAPPGKVEIKRVAPTRDSGSRRGSVKAGGDKRVNHACEQCRRRKTRCSGELPRCQHCRDQKLDCQYGDGKRDKARK